MNGDPTSSSNTLTLPMPRWPFLWPVLALLLYAVNGAFHLVMAQASLEWVGKTLLLHSHLEMDIRLGRGLRAERMARWLVAQGLPMPVGR